jgi:hypothetical protein
MGDFNTHETSGPSSSNRAESSSPDKISAWVMAQHFVEARLKSPGTAEYGSVWGGTYQSPDDCVMSLGKNRYEVRGWVDAQNAFGAKMRSKFIVRLEYLGNEKWRLTEEPILRQR